MALEGRLNTSLYLLLATFVASIIVLVTAIKYINWASPQTEATANTALIFYAGTSPLASTIQSTLHVGVLHFDFVIPRSFAICIASLQTLGWLVTAGIWTHCENTFIPTPGLCPQRVMIDLGRNGLVGIGIFKDAVAWVLTLLYAAMLLLAIKPMWSGTAQKKRKSNYWERRSEFFQLADYETRVV